MQTNSMAEMEEKADKAAAFLGGLASSHRLRILCQLAEGEKCVSELIELTGISQTSMSQHLNRLKDEEIVSFRREHRVLYYFIIHPLTLNIMRVMHDHFCKEKGRKK